MAEDESDWSIEAHRARKQRSREEDARRLAAGEVTREELALENGLFSNRKIIINRRVIHRSFAVHPGRWVSRQVMQRAGLTIREFADRLDIEEATLEPVLDGREPMTPEIAAQIEEVFRISAGTLMRMQKRRDLG
ncbi:HigA family addiction module antitoxin [Qipengyuania gaetbuli]|uniref:HigA family addiction module antitoxin n=1 Tax=Qipengyuania gaetbuli TaxID=266952 RepID=UPI001CFEFDFF|nr:HigA family addiction module antitoxin [Qipengyuania gaetbuli]